MRPKILGRRKIMFIVMFVLDNNELLDKVITSLSEIGVTGATIIESSGLHRKMLHTIHMRYVYEKSPLEEIGNLTLFIIVENKTVANNCLKAIEKVVGNLDQPNTGVFAAWPLAMTKGIPSKRE
jgi:nitrogen regulatory protein P-II 1